MTSYAAKTVRLQWDAENNAETWADEARAHLARFPVGTHGLIMGKLERAYVTPADADQFFAVAASLPGWDDGPEYAREAILRHDCEPVECCYCQAVNVDVPTGKPHVCVHCGETFTASE